MMMQALLQKILDETIIIKSGIEVKDIDIVLNALASRDVLIEEFNQNFTDEVREIFADEIEKFEKENERCIVALEQFKLEMEDEYYKTRVKQKEVKFTKKVHQRYAEVSNSTEGSSIDLKK